MFRIGSLAAQRAEKVRVWEKYPRVPVESVGIVNIWQPIPETPWLFNDIVPGLQGAQKGHAYVMADGSILRIWAVFPTGYRGPDSSSGCYVDVPAEAKVSRNTLVTPLVFGPKNNGWGATSLEVEVAKEATRLGREYVDGGRTPARYMDYVQAIEETGNRLAGATTG